MDVADNGDIYIADTNNHRIRKIDAASGIITTVAGNGTSGYSGDGGPATSAMLDTPTDVFVDAAGQIFIAERFNNSVRMVSVGGIISTVTAALSWPRGVFVTSDQSIYIADTRNNAILKIVGGNTTTIAGGINGVDGDGGLATLARLNEPRKVWVDADGDIYIADTDNNRVRKVDVSTGLISTIGGGGDENGLPAIQATLDYPLGAFVNTNGDLYITSRQRHTVRRVDSMTGTISIIAGTGINGFSGDGGPAVAAQLEQPSDVHLDSNNNVYILDQENQRVRKVDAATGIITTVVGSGAQGFGGDLGAAVGASLNNPNGIHVSAAGDIYIADTVNNRVRKVSGGIITTIAGDGTNASGGDGGSAVSAQVSRPANVFVNGNGDLYIAELQGGSLRKVDVATGIISTISSTVEARDVFVDGDGNVFVASANQIRLVDETTGTWTAYAGTDDSGFSGDGGAAIDAEIDFADCVFGDETGNLYICDSGANRIRKITPAPLLAAPILVDFEGLTTMPYTPTLEWNDVNNAVSYTLEWSNDAAFTTSTVVSGITQSQYTFSEQLALDTYYWRVKTIDADGEESAYSGADSFVIIPTFTEWTVVLLGMTMMGYLVWRLRGI